MNSNPEQESPSSNFKPSVNPELDPRQSEDDLSSNKTNTRLDAALAKAAMLDQQRTAKEVDQARRRREKDEQRLKKVKDESETQRRKADRAAEKAEQERKKQEKKTKKGKSHEEKEPNESEKKLRTFYQGGYAWGYDPHAGLRSSSSIVLPIRPTSSSSTLSIRHDEISPDISVDKEGHALKEPAHRIHRGDTWGIQNAAGQRDPLLGHGALRDRLEAQGVHVGLRVQRQRTNSGETGV